MANLKVMCLCRMVIGDGDNKGGQVFLGARVAEDTLTVVVAGR